MLASYPYLGLSSGLIVLLLVALAVGRGFRAQIFVSAVLQAPLGFLSVFFVPAYWQPRRLVTFGAGFEDLALSFACGGLVWAIASGLFQHRLQVELEWRRIIARYLLFLVPGVAAGVLLLRLGLAVMEATIVVSLVAGALLAWRQRAFLPLGLVGALAFGMVYGVVLKLSFLLWPQFPEQWSTENLWGLGLFGLPLEEVVWGFGGGAVWPLFMTHLLDARWRTGTRGERVSGAAILLLLPRRLGRPVSSEE